ncbi:hypothetical protein, partial [Streptomyces sp. NPDC020362]|uniref:hypothetical protein n=1 Tax=Streptomyces sp. NPDC020362 TaxID=3154486 RepID=UPI0033E2B992
AAQQVVLVRELVHREQFHAAVAPRRRTGCPAVVVRPWSCSGRWAAAEGAGSLRATPATA